MGLFFSGEKGDSESDTRTIRHSHDTSTDMAIFCFVRLLTIILFMMTAFTLRNVFSHHQVRTAFDGSMIKCWEVMAINDFWGGV